MNRKDFAAERKLFQQAVDNDQIATMYDLYVAMAKYAEHLESIVYEVRKAVGAEPDNSPVVSSDELGIDTSKVSPEMRLYNPGNWYKDKE